MSFRYHFLLCIFALTLMLFTFTFTTLSKFYILTPTWILLNGQHGKAKILKVRTHETDMKEFITDVPSHEQSKKKLILNDPSYNLCNQERYKPTGQRVLSYSLFGNGTRFNSGKGEKYRECIRILAGQAKESNLYHDWYIRIYHDNGIAPDILDEHTGNTQIQFCNVENIDFQNHKLKNILGKFWRNLPIADPFVDITCLRDLDSDLLLREEYAVRDWLKSTYLIHSMRDNRQHRIGMLAGMWCFRNHMNRTRGFSLVEDLFERAKHYTSRSDQPLLNGVFWNVLSHNALQHDSFWCKEFKNSIPFPKQREDNYTFIGCAQHNCHRKVEMCPSECRPKDHPGWIYC